MSELRTNTTVFMHHTCERPGFIDGAVLAALDTPVNILHQFPAELREAINISEMNAQAKSQFDWLNINNLLWETVKIGSAPFWSHLMTKADPIKTQNLVKALRSTAEGAPAAMERNNRSFFSMSIPLVFLGALWGEEVNKFINETATSTKAMEAVGAHFKTPAESGQQFQKRLLELFPSLDTDKQAHSAYSFLFLNHAFRSFDHRKPPCPVIVPTQFVFESIGRVLDPSHKYGQTFLQTIGR